MPVYICRWENGEVSFLSAKSKKDACLLLDEFAEVEPDDLHPVSDFMLSFKLTDNGALEVSEMGEDTQELFNQTIYPVLFEARMKVDSASEATPQVKSRIIREAVREENSRPEGKNETPSIQGSRGSNPARAHAYVRSRGGTLRQDRPSQARARRLMRRFANWRPTPLAMGLFSRPSSASKEAQATRP